MKDAGYSGHYSYLHIRSNDPDNPYLRIAIRGDIPKPVLHIDKNIDFGYVKMNHTSHDTITLSNMGALDLLINYLTLSGTNSDQFSYLNPCSVIPPGGSCKVPVSFTPLLSGDLNATLYINSNFSLTPTFPVQLKGTSLYRTLGVSPDTLHFGNISTGESLSSEVHLVNLGENPVTIDYMQIAGPSRSEFRVVGHCSAIPPGGSCADTITFSGYMEGPKTGYLRILSNDSDNPVHTICLYGSVSAGLPLQTLVTANPESGTDPLIVNFTSTVTGGQPPYNYEWDFNDGSYANEPNPLHEFCCPGTYNVYVKISDAFIQSETKHIKVVVGTNGVPAASISAKQSAGPAPLLVEFSSTVFGGNGAISFHWDFGDGSTSQDANPVHTFIAEGNYTVWLTVIDADGDQGFDHIVIQVSSQKHKISGDITDFSGYNFIEKSTVILYKGSYTDVSEFLLLDQGHTYNFQNLDGGIYTIKVIPDPAQYPDKIPTYLGDTYTIVDASWIILNQEFSGQDIHVISKPVHMGGEGIIEGQLVEGESGKKLQVLHQNNGLTTKAIPSCHVYLKDVISNYLLASDITDDQGYFRFDGLLPGSYLFVADYKGKLMDAENASLLIKSPDDSLSILAVAGKEKIQVQIILTGAHKVEYSDFSIYPVPAGDRLMIDLTGGKSYTDITRLSIIDITGKSRSLNYIYQPDGNIIEVDIKGLPEGIYLLKIEERAGTGVWRFIKASK